MFKLLKRNNKCRYDIKEVSNLMAKLHALKNISNNEYYITNNFTEIENINYDRHSDIMNIKTKNNMIISITNTLVLDNEKKGSENFKHQDVLLVESIIDKSTLIPIIKTCKTKDVRFEIGEYLNDVFDDLKENTLRLEKELKEHNNNIRRKNSEIYNIR